LRYAATIARSQSYGRTAKETKQNGGGHDSEEQAPDGQTHL